MLTLSCPAHHPPPHPDYLPNLIESSPHPNQTTFSPLSTTATNARRLSHASSEVPEAGWPHRNAQWLASVATWLWREREKVSHASVPESTGQFCSFELPATGVCGITGLWTCNLLVLGWTVVPLGSTVLLHSYFKQCPVYFNTVSLNTWFHGFI